MESERVRSFNFLWTLVSADNLTWCANTTAVAEEARRRISPPRATEEEESGCGRLSLRHGERPGGAPCSRAPRRVLRGGQKGYPEADKHGTEDQRLPSTLPGRDPGRSLLDPLPSGSCCRFFLKQIDASFPGAAVALDQDTPSSQSLCARVQSMDGH